MRKFTLIISLMVAFAATAVAQSYQVTETLLTSSELNAKTEATYIAIKNISGTNNYWMLGTGNAADFSDAAVFVWTPVTDGQAGTYYLKKVDETYMTRPVPSVFSEDISAGAIFYTTCPSADGSGETYTSAGSESPALTNTDGTSWVRFVLNPGQTHSGWINCNTTGGLPYYTDRTGGFTIHNVYAVEKLPEQEVAKTALTNALSNATNKLNKVGEGLGYYSNSMSNYAEIVTAAQAFYDAMNATTTIEEMEEQTAILNEVNESFSLNVPAVGKYYMFKGYRSNYYINVTATSGNMGMSAEAGAGSIFYLAEGNVPVNYFTGTGITGTHSINTGLVADYAEALTFNASEGGIAGAFTIKTNFSGSKYMYDHADQNKVNRNSAYADRCNWVIEEVTTLPVTITSAGWATLCAPVALTIPTGVKAYAVTEAANSVATLAEVSGTIHAGVAVVLNGAEGTYDFAITTGGTTPAANLLKGTTAKTQFTKENGKSYYVLAVNSEGVASFQNAVNDEDATTFFNAGHKAYLVIEGSEEATSYSFRFEDGATTAIESVEAAGSNGAIYDLAGRRVENTDAPGIYIVNGKKIVVK